MNPRELADWLENLGEFPPLFPDKIIAALRAQADEIDALKAAAIVRGSTKLDEAAKQALGRERLAAEIDALRSQNILRAMQIKNLMAENARLRAEAKTIPVERCK